MHLPLRHALLLTAGLGTRLRPLTLVRAKPAIPLGGVPLVSRIVTWLVSQGVCELVLNLHYRPETIAAEIGDGAHLGARVRYSWEGSEVLGSAGGPRLATPLITAGGPGAPGADVFFIVNGDTLTNVELADVARAHLASDALVTMALIPNREPQHYGGVRLDSSGRVIGFARRGADAVDSFHFIGVQVAAATAFAELPMGAPANSVGDLYDRLIARQPGCIRGHICAAEFWDIGSVADYWRTSQAFSARAVPPGAHATLGRGRDVRGDAGATVRDSILWDRVTIGAGATLERCIVTDDVIVPAGASYRDAILRHDPRQGLIVAPRPLSE